MRNVSDFDGDYRNTQRMCETCGDCSLVLLLCKASMKFASLKVDTSFMWWGESTRQGTWCLFICSVSYNQHFIRVSMEKEDNVFCGSVMPLCLMRGNTVFEELQKFYLLACNLNTVGFCPFS